VVKKVLRRGINNTSGPEFIECFIRRLTTLSRPSLAPGPTHTQTHVGCSIRQKRAQIKNFLLLLLFRSFLPLPERKKSFLASESNVRKRSSKLRSTTSPPLPEGREGIYRLFIGDKFLPRPTLTNTHTLAWLGLAWLGLAWLGLAGLSQGEPNKGEEILHISPLSLKGSSSSSSPSSELKIPIGIARRLFSSRDCILLPPHPHPHPHPLLRLGAKNALLLLPPFPTRVRRAMTASTNE